MKQAEKIQHLLLSMLVRTNKKLALSLLIKIFLLCNRSYWLVSKTFTTGYLST